MCKFTHLGLPGLLPSLLASRFPSLFSSYLGPSLQGGQSRGKERVGPVGVSVQCGSLLGAP